MVTIVFSGIAYFVICNWIQLFYLLGNIFKPKRIIKKVNGKGILPKLKKKTGLDLEIKTMSEKRKAIGFMVSCPPFRPVMIFSEKMYTLLTKDEFEWVALHESAHYLMWHNFRFAVVQFLVLLLGINISLLFVFEPWMTTSFFICLSILYIQMVKRYEYQADSFAIKNMDKPQALISAQKKLRAVNGFLNASNFLYNMLVIQVPYEIRMKMAENELILRNQA